MLKRHRAGVKEVARRLEREANKHNESADATCAVAGCFDSDGGLSDEVFDSVFETVTELALVNFEIARDFIRVVQPRSGDPKRQEAIIGELGKCMVRRPIERRANAERAKDFFGRRVVFQDGFNLTPGGEGVLSGVLTGASGNGSVNVSIKKEGFRSPHMSTCNVESLLIVVDEEEADGAASPHNDEPQSEQPRKGFFERLRGSREE